MKKKKGALDREKKSKLAVKFIIVSFSLYFWLTHTHSPNEREIAKYSSVFYSLVICRKKRSNVCHKTGPLPHKMIASLETPWTVVCR